MLLAIPTVREDAEDDADELDTDDFAAKATAHLRPRFEHHSNLSGATAFTTRSAVAIDALREAANQLPADLSLLHNAAKKLLDLAIPPSLIDSDESDDLAEQFTLSGSSAAQSLREAESTLSTVADPYSNENYLRPSDLLLAFFHLTPDDSIGEGSWRPDNILYKANLAKCAFNLMTIDWDNGPSSQSRDFLNLMNDVFPQPYLSSTVVAKEEDKITGASDLDDLTFDIALAMRVQCFIMSLRSFPKVHLESLWLEAFFDLDDELAPHDDSSVSGPPLKSWNFVGGEGVASTLSPNQEIEIERILNEIRACLGPRPAWTKKIAAGKLRKLEQTFSWADFRYQMIRWILARDSELESVLGGSKGVKGISETLQKEFNRREKSTQPIRFAGGEPKVWREFNKRKSLMNAEQRHTHESTIPNPKRASETDPQGIPAVDHAGHGLADEAVEEPLPGLEDDDIAPPSIDVIEVDESSGLRKAPASRGGTKSGAFYANQQDAQQVTFDSQDLIVVVPSNATSQSRQTDRADATEDNVTQDTGFQDQGLGNAAADARRKVMQEALKKSNAGKSNKRAAPDDFEPRNSSPKQAPRVPDSSYDPQEDENNIEEDRRQSETQNQQRNNDNGDTIERTSIGEAPPSSSYLEVNDMAKAVVVQKKPYIPQTRTPWSQSEINTLLAGIARHGPQFAVIKKKDSENGDILHRRDQTGIRDKLRNMKFDYLK